MKYQALLLALVILISLLINPVKNMTFENPENPKISELPNVQSENVLTSISETFVQNLYAAKIIFANSLDAIFSQPTEIETMEIEAEIPASDVLVSQTNINKNETFPCVSSYEDFNSQAILVKKLKQYSSAEENIFQLNPEKRWPIASLTKLMTAVVAFEKMDLDKEIILSEKAVLSEGTAGDFKAGEIFKLKDLIKAMLVSSSNDAAVAVAENFENGESDFINEMQKKASQLKMFSTTYLEPTGLSFVNQSTIGDLAKLVDYIYFNHPEILKISRQKQTEITELQTNKIRTLLSTGKFAGDDDFLGGKTGYIDAAGRNLIAIFDIDSEAILTITLGSEDAFKETEKLKELVRSCQ